MDPKNQFQLLPGTKKRLGIKVPGENRFLYIGSAILGAILVTSFALSKYDSGLSDQINQVISDISAIDQKRDIQGEQNLKVAKQEIEVTSNLIKDHIFWTRGLSRIASLIQNQIQIESFVDEGGNEVVLKAFAGSYSALAKQVASFIYDDSITDVQISRISPSQTGKLEFDAKLTIDVAKLLKKESEDNTKGENKEENKTAN